MIIERVRNCCLGALATTLEQRDGTLFTVFGNLSKRPYWFHSQYLKSRKAVHLQHIPNVECVLQTLLHVNQWEPEGEAEILIFGRPYYQEDVAKMIMNLADYHCQLWAQSSEEVPAQDTSTQPSPSPQGSDPGTPSEAACEVATQSSPSTACEAATQDPVTRS
uniref:KH-like RNA-binding domain-containing protein n=1 Tax=Ailuropoda melanoleuca TaxID=9646 RepID=G1LMP5_AILME